MCMIKKFSSPKGNHDVVHREEDHDGGHAVVHTGEGKEGDHDVVHREESQDEGQGGCHFRCVSS